MWLHAFSFGKMALTVPFYAILKQGSTGCFFFEQPPVVPSWHKTTGGRKVP
jgi:hypothetical protein